MSQKIIDTISGRGIPVRGNDIDTDRIIPARYLRCVTFEGLGAHAFEDDRKQVQATGDTHPWDDPRYQGASILFVNQNFGCGSSREHAPQALMRWGIRALVGESFAEIFFGNCVSLGIPCLSVEAGVIDSMMESVSSHPEVEWKVDVRSSLVQGDKEYLASLPPGTRDQFLRGSWNALGELLQSTEAVAAKAQSIPYTQWG
ncbi:MAG: 3-isopropylmalate dehydratase small subunit [Okeania sp. SIO1H5]|uniref:3-isopropylmalate dehydratase small subunit n=1 Tax=Okeania sp. SIO1H5 TaxID=2607777 RepID=UPI0013BDA49F|nr:3-isopropylmalate dehydratase small subunit [Okeania sp. SIO1H5]NET23822.1 3-isopropylmalate dehydratase small subunit [Okeania sp. SIO1H5]